MLRSLCFWAQLVCANTILKTNFIVIYSPSEGNISLQISEEVADKWASLPADEHIPLSQFMIAMSIKAIALSTLGREMQDDKELMKIRKAYETVSNVLMDMCAITRTISYLYITIS